MFSKQRDSKYRLSLLVDLFGFSLVFFFYFDLFEFQGDEKLREML